MNPTPHPKTLVLAGIALLALLAILGPPPP